MREFSAELREEFGFDPDGTWCSILIWSGEFSILGTICACSVSFGSDTGSGTVDSAADDCASDLSRKEISLLEKDLTVRLQFKMIEDENIYL